MVILLTLFTVLFERKVLAFAQRRMGPTLMGRNGAFQILKAMTSAVLLG